MNRVIEILPALKRVELKHVGCWKELKIDFLPGLNIITGDCGSGKSTIFRAILHAMHPSVQMDYPISTTAGYSEGSISVELMSPKFSIPLNRPSANPSVRSINESQGEFILRSLCFYIENALPSTVILLDSDVIGVLDDSKYHKAVSLLNKSSCQVICLIQHHRLDPNDFRTARIYYCFWDQVEHTARIRLQQSGGTDR